MPSEKQLGQEWYKVLSPVFDTDWWHNLHRKVWEAANRGIQPEPKNIFRAFRETPFDKVKVVLLGQDPYPQGGYADGLAFSSGNGRLPKSLDFIYRELEFEYGRRPAIYSLESWAHQGVLLLNTSLTVDANKPLSHADYGWDKFIIAVLQQLSEHAETGLIFIVWGTPAQALLNRSGINPSLAVIRGYHPIAESYSNGAVKFVGGNYFKRVNELLEQQGKEPIKWV